MSIWGSISGAIVGICIGVIIATLKEWGFDLNYDRAQYAWTVTICAAIIGWIVGGVIGSRLKIGK